MNVSLRISALRTTPFAVAAGLLLALIAAVAPAQGADLTDGQKKLLEEVRSHIKRFESNLKLAQDTAGKGDGKPSGSRAKLAMARLDSAKQSIQIIQPRIEKLPADNAEVRAAQKEYDALVAAANALEARLTGQDPAEAAQAQEGTKLDYKQEEQLKNARFSLRQLQGEVDALTKLVAELKPIEDQTTIDHRKVQQGMASMEVAVRRTNETRNALTDLPEDGRGVKATIEELNKAIEAGNAASQFLVPLHKKLTQLIDPAQYPDLKADTDRLSELSTMYNNPRILIENRPLAVTVVAEAPAAIAERDRIVKKYVVLCQQQTPEGKLIVGNSNGFAKNLEQFAAAAKAEKESLPSQIDEDLGAMHKLMEEAVNEKKPLFFTGGIPQHEEFAKDKITLLKALDAEKGAAYEKKLAETQAAIKKAQAALREQIITTNKLPADRYTGSDREALNKKAIETWKKREANAEILTVRIPAEGWKRETMWRFNNGTAYKIDRSQLQAQVIVKLDNKLAAIRPINLWINHVSNDQLTATPFHDEGEELEPHELLLLENVK